MPAGLRDATRRPGGPCIDKKGASMVLPLVLVSIGMAVTGQLLLKVGAHTPVHGLGDLLTDLLRPATVAAFALSVAAALLWITVLSRSPLSYAYPLLGLGYALAVLLSAVLLGEHVSAQRWIGVLLIVLGFVVVAAS
jgi:drug/metabolite transporter (DMT)-like permease